MSTPTTHPQIRMPSLVVALALCIAGSTTSAQRNAPIPGWAALMSHDGEYSIASEPLRRHGGNGSIGVAIASRVADPDGSALLIQSIRADEFRGHRVRLSGWLRTEDVEGQAGLFARVDGAGIVQTSDYMLGRPVAGTTAWRQYDVVLDVPRDAIGITFGLQFTGTGQIYGDDFSLDAVGMDVAATGGPGNVIFPTASREADGNGGGVMLAGAPRTTNTAQIRDQQRKYSRTLLRPSNLDFEQVPEF